MFQGANHVISAASVTIFAATVTGGQQLQADGARGVFVFVGHARWCR
jgi:hypothetical protein